MDEPDSLDLGAPTPTINAAVESRHYLGYKDEACCRFEVLNGPDPKISVDPQIVIGRRYAMRSMPPRFVLMPRVFGLMRMASRNMATTEYGEIAKSGAGCIIRARFLNDIRAAFARTPDLANLMIDPEFAEADERPPASLAQSGGAAAESGIPALHSVSPGLITMPMSERLPANLKQAQRDYFGATRIAA